MKAITNACIGQISDVTFCAKKRTKAAIKNLLGEPGVMCKKGFTLKIYFRITLICLILLVSGCANFSKYDAAFYDIKFGVLYKDDSSIYAIKESNTIPYILGSSNQMFGYLITPKHGDKYQYNAVVVLPKAPTQLEGKYIGTRESSTTQGLDTGLATTKGPSTVNMWLNKGDAKGIHQVSLYINGTLADSREFLIK